MLVMKVSHINAGDSSILIAYFESKRKAKNLYHDYKISVRLLIPSFRTISAEINLSQQVIF